jgi:hypothetical protein
LTVTDARAQQIIDDAAGLDADLTSTTAARDTAVSQLTTTQGDLAAAQQALGQRTAERDAALADAAALRAQLAATSLARFPGDPGPGRVLIGSTVYTGSAGIPDGRVWLTQQTGKQHVIARTYASQGLDRDAAAAAHNAGVLPLVSFKLAAYTPAQVAAAAADAVIDADAAWCKAQGKAIWACYFHEPEDNFPSDAAAADYRAAFRRVVTRYRQAGATNVAWLPIFMASWSFIPTGGEASRGPWYKWDPDWRGTKTGGNGARPGPSDWYRDAQSVVDLLGMDQYCPTVGGSAYHEAAADLDTALARMAADARPGKPWCVPEFGTSAVTSTSSPLPADGWAGYYSRALSYISAQGGVGVCAYMTDGANFSNGSDAAARFAGYKAGALAHPAAAFTVTL